MVDQEHREGSLRPPLTILWYDDDIKSSDLEDLTGALNTPDLKYRPAFNYQILGAQTHQDMAETLKNHLQRETRVDLILADLTQRSLDAIEQMLAHLRAEGLKDLPIIIYSGWEYKKAGKDIPLLDWIGKVRPLENVAARIQENILNINNRRYFWKDLFGSPTGR